MKLFTRWSMRVDGRETRFCDARGTLLVPSLWISTSRKFSRTLNTELRQSTMLVPRCFSHLTASRSMCWKRLGLAKKRPCLSATSPPCLLAETWLCLVLFIERCLAADPNSFASSLRLLVSALRQTDIACKSESTVGEAMQPGQKSGGGVPRMPPSRIISRDLHSACAQLTTCFLPELLRVLVVFLVSKLNCNSS